MIKESELVLAPDGSLYHIHLTGEMLADDVFLVGDPGRVDMFKHLFDEVELETYNRELHAITGSYKGHRFTALSTGMGCDNIDIVLSELDAAANMDLQQRTPRAEHRTLRLVRIGTCGALHADIACGTLVASAYAIGLDGLVHYYQHEEALFEMEMQRAFADHMNMGGSFAAPYCVRGSAQLLQEVAQGMVQGITCTAPGFYGPQGRHLRIAPAVEQLNERLSTFSWQGQRVLNLEMETSAIYGLSAIMGHQALTVCMVIANRVTGTFLNEYHVQMQQTITGIMDCLSGK